MKCLFIFSWNFIPYSNVKYSSGLFLLLVVLPVITAAYKTKQINVGEFVKILVVVAVSIIFAAFFIDEDEPLDELAIKSSANFINYYAATQYFVNPLIYKIKRNEISEMGNIGKTKKLKLRLKSETDFNFQLITN